MGPVLEDGSVAAIGDQFVRVLGHGGIQVVLDHQHDGCGLPALGGILVDGTGVHLVVGTVAVHVDTAVFVQFLHKFRCEGGVEGGIEVAECIAQGQLLLCGSQNILALRGVVDGGVVRFQCGQFGRNALHKILLEFL